jgi:hypothetical protein
MHVLKIVEKNKNQKNLFFFNLILNIYFYIPFDSIFNALSEYIILI